MSKKNRVAFVTWDDKEVRRMLVQKGFHISFDEDGEHDVVVFPGGADVSPFLYGEVKLKETQANFRRDMKETKIYRKVPFDVPKIGICRGGQFLNVMNGGSLWQDVDNHAIGGTHVAKDVDRKQTVNVTSTHHQMIIPYSSARVLCVANLATSKANGEKMVSLFENDWEDVEACYYASTNTLCFQPHPEYGKKECEEYFWHLVDTHVKWK